MSRHTICPVVAHRLSHGDMGRPAVRLQRRLQKDGSTKWIITDGCEVLTRGGDWLAKPARSHYDADFMAATRFNSSCEALQAWQDHLQHPG